MAKLFVVGGQKKETNEAKRYYFKAHDALKSGKYIKAIQYLKRSIKIKPDFLSPYRDLADLYQQQGNSEEAQIYISKALEIDPDDPVSLFIQGTIYISRGHIKPALDFFEKSKKTGELTWGLAYNIGLCHYCLGDLEPATHFLETAIQKDPIQSQPYLLLAQIYIRQKRIDIAKESLAKAKKMRPYDQQLDAWISDILNSLKWSKD